MQDEQRGDWGIFGYTEIIGFLKLNEGYAGLQVWRGIGEGCCGREECGFDFAGE